MKDFSIPMALLDLVPVIFFAIAAIMLQRALYSKMSKGAFALFAAGTIDIIIVGFLKAIYKFLYAAGICDSQALCTLQFPAMSIGFLLAGIGLVAMLVHNQNEDKALCAALPVISGVPIFVSIMIVGLFCMTVVLSIIAFRLKKPLAIFFFVVSFVASLAMGYLSSKDFCASHMNWIAEVINICGQLSFLLGVILLKRAGLAKLIITHK